MRLKSQPELLEGVSSASDRAREGVNGTIGGYVVDPG